MLGVPGGGIGFVRKNSFDNEDADEEISVNSRRILDKKQRVSNISGLIPGELRNIMDEGNQEDYLYQKEKKTHKIDKNIMIEEIDQFENNSDLDNENKQLSFHNPDAMVSAKRQLLAESKVKLPKQSRKLSDQSSQLPRTLSFKKDISPQKDIQNQITNQTSNIQNASQQQKRKSKVQQQGTIGSQSEKSQLFKQQMKKLVKTYLNRSQSAINEDSKSIQNENLKKEGSSFNKKEQKQSSKEKSGSGKGNYIKLDNKTETLLNESYSEEEEKQIQKRKFRFLIRVNGEFRIKWDLFVMILSIWNCYTLPLDVAFQPIIFEHPFFSILNNVIDICFAVDIVLNFRTTFLNRQTGDEVIDSKSIGMKYLKANLIIDLLATIPFDQVFSGILETSKAKQLQLFSMLKLLRVLRLSKIITYMNSTDEVKLSLKLFKMLFFLIMYLHCQACAWFYITSIDQNWIPPVNLAYNDYGFFYDDTTSQYCMSFYTSLLILYGGDQSPRGNTQLTFLALAYIAGALINANILGTIAVIIQTMNRRASRFQEQIDIANTAMKNMKLPEDLQRKVQDFMMFTQSNLDYQKQLDMFLNMISPSLRLQVTQHIFLNAISKNSIFKGNSELIRFVVHNIITLLYLPEDIIIRQDTKAHHLFFLAQGTCEVWVRDQYKREIFVRNLFQGMLFGEVALIAQVKRTASVKSKNYCTLAALNDENFYEMCHQFPDIFFRMKQETLKYNDKWKVFQKKVISSIEYFSNLSEELIEELHYKLSLEYFEQDTEIFSTSDNCDALYFIVEGEVDLIIQQQDEDELLLDTLYTGCSIGSYSLIQQQKYPYTARARNNVTLLVLSRADLYEAVDVIEELNYALWDAEEFINNNGVPLCDYTIYRAIWRNNNQNLSPLQKFQNAVRRVTILNQRNKRKQIKFLDLIDKLRDNILRNKYGEKAFKKPSLTLKNHKLRNHLSLAPFIQKHIVNQMKIKTADQGIDYYQLNHKKTTGLNTTNHNNLNDNDNSNLKPRDQAIVSKLTFKIESLSDHIKKQNKQMLIMQRLFNQKINNLIEYQKPSKNPSSFSQSSHIKTDDEQNNSDSRPGSDLSRKQRRKIKEQFANKSMNQNSEIELGYQLNMQRAPSQFKDYNQLPITNSGTYKHKKKKVQLQQQNDKLSQTKEKFKTMQLESLNKQTQNFHHSTDQKKVYNIQVTLQEDEKLQNEVDQLDLGTLNLQKAISNQSSRSKEQSSKASNRYRNAYDDNDENQNHYDNQKFKEDTGATNMNFNRQDSSETQRVDLVHKPKIIQNFSQMADVVEQVQNKIQDSEKNKNNDKNNNNKGLNKLDKNQLAIANLDKQAQESRSNKAPSQNSSNVNTPKRDQIRLQIVQNEVSKKLSDSRIQNSGQKLQENGMGGGESQLALDKIKQAIQGNQKSHNHSDALLKINIDAVLQKQKYQQQIINKMQGNHPHSSKILSSAQNPTYQNSNFLDYKQAQLPTNRKSANLLAQQDSKQMSNQSQNSSRSKKSQQDQLFEEYQKDLIIQKRIQSQIGKAIDAKNMNKQTGQTTRQVLSQESIIQQHNQKFTNTEQKKLSTQELILLKMTQQKPFTQSAQLSYSREQNHQVILSSSQRNGSTKLEQNDTQFNLPSQPPLLQKNKSSMKDETNAQDRVQKKVQIQQQFQPNQTNSQKLQNNFEQKNQQKQESNQDQRQNQNSNQQQSDFEKLKLLKMELEKQLSKQYDKNVSSREQNQINQQQKSQKQQNTQPSRREDISKHKDQEKIANAQQNQDERDRQSIKNQNSKQLQKLIQQQNQKIDRMTTKEINQVIDEEILTSNKKSQNQKRRESIIDKNRKIDEMLAKHFNEEIGFDGNSDYDDLAEERQEIERRLQNINEEENDSDLYYDET